jgi:hypothetical protein
MGGVPSLRLGPPRYPVGQYRLKPADDRLCPRIDVRVATAPEGEGATPATAIGVRDIKGRSTAAAIRKKEAMIVGSWHCGAVRLEVDTPPDVVTDCACSICRRKSARWAYYSPTHVRIIPATGATSIYTWEDKTIEFHSCKICACSPIGRRSTRATGRRMGVNMRMMGSEILAAARVEKITGP